MDVKKIEAEVLKTLRPSSLLKRMATFRRGGQSRGLSVRRAGERHDWGGAPGRWRRGQGRYLAENRLGIPVQDFEIEPEAAGLRC